MNNNGKITRRINQWLRPRIVTPKKRARLVKENISLLCNNCTGGFILHDLGLRFDSPTINMFFHGLDFFDFIEHLEYYITTYSDTKSEVRPGSTRLSRCNYKRGGVFQRHRVAFPTL